MATKKVSQGTRSSQKRVSSPAPHRGALGKQTVSEVIRRAAKRAGIEPADDTEIVNVDLARAALEIQLAFDDVLTAELSDDAGQHDVLVLRALRRLRQAKSMVECEMGGAQ